MSRLGFLQLDEMRTKTINCTSKRTLSVSGVPTIAFYRRSPYRPLSSVLPHSLGLISGIQESENEEDKRAQRNFRPLIHFADLCTHAHRGRFILM